MHRIVVIALILSSTLLMAQDSDSTERVKKKTKVEIVRANELIYNQQVGRYQICRGNVRFKQGTVLMDCDSARFYELTNRIEAFGRIHIQQKDTMDLKGDYLDYDGDLRLAQVVGNVRLTDGDMVLKTERINYDMESKIGYYTSGGTITNRGDKLYSRRGTYLSRSKEFLFKDSVRLTNPEYEMTSDTLNYHTVTKVARFFGPTYIHSEENTIFCNYGWYNTEKEISQFSKGVYIEGKDNRLEADSMVYYRESGYGEGHGNLKLTDTVEHITITGNYGQYYRLVKRTMITDDPMAMKIMDGDTLWISSDTMLDMRDTLDQRTLLVYHGVKMFKSDLQGRSDSMVYRVSDSAITLYTEPIIWADSNQITGDTIIIYQNQDGLEKLEAYYNGFVAEKDMNGFFNQIAGKEITAHFNEGKLHTIHVVGNGQSVYYAQEDSMQYSGVNDVVCGRMTIRVDSTTRIRTISFFGQPKATFYPLEKFPPAKQRLPGLDWKASLKPKRIDF